MGMFMQHDKEIREDYIMDAETGSSKLWSPLMY